MTDVTLTPIPFNGGTLSAGLHQHDIILLDKNNHRFVYFFQQTNPSYWFLGLARIVNPLSGSASVSVIKQRAFLGTLSTSNVFLSRISNTRFLVSYYKTSSSIENRIFDVSTNDFVEVSESFVVNNVRDTSSSSLKNKWTVIPVSNNEFNIACIASTSYRLNFTTCTFTDGSTVNVTTNLYNIFSPYSDRVYFMKDSSSNIYILVKYGNYVYDVYKKDSSSTLVQVYNRDVSSGLYAIATIDPNLFIGYGSDVNTWYKYDGTNWNTVSTSFYPRSLVSSIHFFGEKPDTIFHLGTTTTSHTIDIVGYDKNSDVLTASQLTQSSSLSFTDTTVASTIAPLSDDNFGGVPGLAVNPSTYVLARKNNNDPQWFVRYVQAKR